MKKLVYGALSGAVSIATVVMMGGGAMAANLVSEPFSGIATPANAWTSGGGAPACLTAAVTSATDSVPACASGPLDTDGSGVLRLTNSDDNQRGFAFYNTPVATSSGLKIDFDMYQYGGDGADGISFFLIDGNVSPTQPGADGGSLGYSSGGITPGLVGGYVGIGFDRFGNFSLNGLGAGGNGVHPNSITIRGSETSQYQFISQKTASGALGVEAATNRADAKRHVTVSISTSNMLSVAVDYGNGPVTEVSSLDLNTVNGSGSLPASLKFGFASSTGAFSNNHEIGGFAVESLPPKLVLGLSHSGDFARGAAGTITANVSNDVDGGSTTGDISFTTTLPSGLTPQSASGNGWVCTINGQQVACTRPGSGINTLLASAQVPNISIQVGVSTTATNNLTVTASTTTADNINTRSTASDPIAITGIVLAASSTVGAPNTGIAEQGIITPLVQLSSGATMAGLAVVHRRRNR